MTFILLIFWWGPSAGVISQVNFDTLAACEAARKQIIGYMSTNVEGSKNAVCVRR